VTEVRIRVRGPHLGASHGNSERVGLLLDVARLERPREAGPPGAGIVLSRRAGTAVLLTRRPRRSLPYGCPRTHFWKGRSVPSCCVTSVLHGRQGLPEIGVAWLWLYGIHRVSHLRWRCFRADVVTFPASSPQISATARSRPHPVRYINNGPDSSWRNPGGTPRRPASSGRPQ